MTLLPDINLSIKRIAYLLGLVLYFNIVACVDSAQPYERYYYPWTSQYDTVVYVYGARGNQQGEQFHFMHKIEKGADLYIEKIIYNQDFHALSRTIEKRISNGYICTEYSLYNRTERGGVDTVVAEVLSGQMFYFDEMDKNTTLVQHYHLKNVDSAAHEMIIIRNMQYDGEERYTFAEKEYSAISMKIVGEIEDIQSGSVVLDLKGENIYVEGIGCVNFTQSIENTISHDYIYKEKLNAQEWKALRNEVQ